MIRRFILYTLLTLGLLVSTYPFAWMLVTSLKSLQSASIPSLSLWPNEWNWSNYREALNAAPFPRYFFNSFFVAVIVTTMVCVSASLAGYAFARLRFKGQGLLFAAVLSTMMLPFEVTLIPNFVFVSKLGWYNSYAALIVPWCANAFAIFLMRQAFLSIPQEYADAARIDGCGHLRFLARVGLPLARPSLITVALFAFLGSYNSLVWPLVVTGDDSMRVVQVGLTVFSGAEGVRTNLLMCASVVVILPVVGLYFAAQRHFIESAIGAGLKG